MRIAFMIDSLSIGGAQKHLCQVACGLADRGHAVRVFCLNDAPHEKYLAPLRAARVEVDVVGKVKVLSGVALLTITWRLWHWRCDVLAVMLFVSTIVGRVCAGIARLPTLNCIQARNVDYAWWQLLALKLSVPLQEIVVSNSRQAIAFAALNEGIDPAVASLVPNVVEPPLPSKAVQLEQLGVPAIRGAKVVGSLGRLNFQKGYDFLIEVASVTAQEEPPIQFVVFGRGPEEARLRKAIVERSLSHRFFLCGEVANATDWIETFDIYVQPSRFEGTPNAVMEALVRGVRVLASNVDGMTDLAHLAGESMKLMQPDVGSWQAAIISALRDGPRRSAFASIRILDAYTLEKTLIEYERNLDRASNRACIDSP